MTPEKTVLVLGATGGVGGAIAAALHRHGWQVRGMARDLAATQQRMRAVDDWRQGDAMVRQDVLRAAEGVSAIVHAVNPPGYRNWPKVVLPMIDNTIAAARAVGGARVVLPGTIYNFDPARTPVIRGDSPQEPRSVKGKIRVALERRLEMAAPEVPVMILRAGDFYGPGARSSWFSEAMVRPGKPIRRITNPALGPGHSWAYLPDLAEAFARLMAMEDRLRPFERLQFEGLYDDTGVRMTDAIRRAAGRDVPIRRLPWWIFKAAAPFGGFPRQAAEIASHWQYPLRLDNTRLVELLGAEPRTDLDEAMRATLTELGCLDDAPLAPMHAQA